MVERENYKRNRKIADPSRNNESTILFQYFSGLITTFRELGG
jgi:hypothetical protein